MVFCLLYSPCLATISVFKKEIGRKWTWISIVMQFAVAYILALISFNIYRLIEIVGALNSIWIFLAAVAISCSIVFVVNRVKQKKYCSFGNNCKNCNKCKKN